MRVHVHVIVFSLRFLFFIMCSSCRFLAADSWQFAWWLNGRQLWPLPESIFFLDDSCWLSLCYHYVPTRFNLHLYFWFCSSFSFSDCLVAKTKQKQKTTHKKEAKKPTRKHCCECFRHAVIYNITDLQHIVESKENIIPGFCSLCVCFCGGTGRHIAESALSGIIHVWLEC